MHCRMLLDCCDTPDDDDDACNDDHHVLVFWQVSHGSLLRPTRTLEHLEPSRHNSGIRRVLWQVSHGSPLRSDPDFSDRFRRTLEHLERSHHNSAEASVVASVSRECCGKCLI